MEKDNVNKSRKMKINIKGRFKKAWGSLFLRNRIKGLGVNVHQLNEPNNEEIELILSGNKNHLWEVVKWTKNQSVFFVLTEVSFEFVK